MKIDLTNIPAEGKYTKFKLTPDLWKAHSGKDDRILGLESPLFGWIKLYKAGESIVAEGCVSGGLILRCDRCVESYTKSLSKDFKLYLSLLPYKGGSDVSLSRDDLDLEFIDDNYLDVYRVIEEQLILAMPIKTICSNDCKGLCPMCGCNLNRITCSCSRNTNC